MAENHVARGLQLIDKQRGLIAWLTPDRRVWEQASEVLAKLQEMQELHEQHRDRLKRELQGTNLPRDGCPQFYLERARDSEERAYLAREPKNQMLFRDLARQWKELALQVQDLEQDYGVRWPKE